ncbi:MAG TPA: hypothetical protein VNF99_19995, partial [Stellaceae bacterium]|nr:hypothetical protein [Stellaceae bacterium]
MTTSFDTGYLSSTITLSNTNLTATYTATYTGAGGVYGNTGYATGAHQVTFTVDDLPSGANMQFGLVTHSHSVDTSLEDSSSVCVTQSGQIYYGGDYSSGGEIGSFSNGDTITIQFNNGQAWFKHNAGYWNGSSTANPASGVGGIGLSYMGSGATIYPAFWTDTENSATTADFSQWDVMNGTTFDSSYQSSTITLSDNDLTATYTATYTGAGGVFGTTGYNGGTHQVTFTVDDLPSGANMQFGFANHSHTVDTSLEDSSSVCVTQTGQIYYGGDYSSGGNLGTISEGNTVTIQFNGGQAWFRLNSGYWNGSSTANPSTGTGGIDLGYMLGSGASAYPAFWTDSENGATTADFSQWGIRVPAAIAGKSWTQIANLNFGTASGNNITSLDDFRNAGWAPWSINGSFSENNNGYGIETYLSDQSNNFAVFTNHAEMYAIHPSGTTIPTLGDNKQSNGNGSILSFSAGLQQTIACPGYYEGEFQVPNVEGSWPAWWCIGWDGSSRTWGPEIDGFEFFNNGDPGHGTTTCFSTLHNDGTDSSSSKCFLSAGGVPSYTINDSSNTIYNTYSGSNMGGFQYTPGTDFSTGYHRYGWLIDTNHNISIWIDDVLIGTFDANEFAEEDGTPVTPLLLVNLEAGWQGGQPV